MIRTPTVEGVTRFADRIVQDQCLVCRAPFTKNAPNQKCCSERCRLNRNRQRDMVNSRRRRARRAA
jgi:predicted nucleic acid-binding Zn ribbon protein